MVKGSFYQDGIIVINMYVPNIRVPRYIKQILRNLMGDTENNTIKAENSFNFQKWIDHPNRKLTWKCCM